MGFHLLAWIDQGFVQGQGEAGGRGQGSVGNAGDALEVQLLQQGAVAVQHPVEQVGIGNDLAQVDVVIEDRPGGLHVLAEQQTADIKEVEDQRGGGLLTGRVGLAFLRHPQGTAVAIGTGVLVEPALPPPVDQGFELAGLLPQVILHQQVLRQRQQQPVGGIVQPCLQQAIEALLLAPDAAQHQHALGRGLAHQPQHGRIAGAHLQQQLVGGSPELALAHDLQKQRIGVAGVVLDALGGRIGAAAGDHHRLIGVEQKRCSNVLARQGGQGDGIHPQIFEQVVGQGGGGIEVTVLGIDDQR